MWEAGEAPGQHDKTLSQEERGTERQRGRWRERGTSVHSQIPFLKKNLPYANHHDVYPARSLSEGLRSLQYITISIFLGCK
jgi:hypothetical protein